VTRHFLAATTDARARGGCYNELMPEPVRPVLGLNPCLQRFSIIIAGAVAALIAWTIVARFLPILVLLLTSALVAFLLGPLVDRLYRRGVLRLGAILLLYLTILGRMALALGSSSAH
jgi:predicted PurR-regulated permease PerM